MSRLLRSRILWIFLSVVAVLVAGFLWAQNTTWHAIDKTLSVEVPKSDKSQPEFYAPGYQPELIYSEDRTPCADRDPLKSAFFGDLHVHTALSADAYPDGTRVYPEDAYAFAKGGLIELPVPKGFAPIRTQLRRPLDFTAITDHSESIGEGYICRTEGAFPGYDTNECRTFRRGEDAGLRMFTVVHAGTKPGRKKNVCGENGEDCHVAAKIVWQQTIDAAEAAYDRSADCSFTSFVGYEYTRSPSGMHMHRNMIFKNATVPDEPATFIEYPLLPQLLNSLESECREGLDDCDVITIPHNSNISGGNGFNPRELEGFSPEAEANHRIQRAAFERLMEISQHKGTSECVNGVTDILGDSDEYCDIEAIRRIGQNTLAFDYTTWIPRLYRKTLEECDADDLDPKDNLFKGPCVSSRDFARGAWLEGLRLEDQTGTNPFESGVIGSTDSHVGTPGNTEEASFPGHIAHETTLEGRLGEAGLGRHNRIEGNPGALAGVWAVENSRDALFQSMKRREAFATSGTRIAPRFFMGDYAPGICDAEDWLSTAYAKGVPMGAKHAPITEQPVFLLQATRDQHSSGRPLKLIQLIKGWVDEEGKKHAEVIDVAGSRDIDDAKDGASSLCARYVDETYNPNLRTYYYMRVLETPRLRWSSAQCYGANGLETGDRPSGCDTVKPNDLTHELAWTSPIWVEPAE
ncbi:MAG: DUF3604 domain-containing protein [Pseudomonadota bacterium]